MAHQILCRSFNPAVCAERSCASGEGGLGCRVLGFLADDGAGLSGIVC